MIFEYSVQKTFDQSIDVVDIGNTALRCTSRQMLDYYIVIKTVLGKTFILKFGPIIPDLDNLIEDFAVSYKKIDYKENMISKEIDKFINDYKKDIDTIVEITDYEALQEFPQVVQCFKNL